MIIYINLYKMTEINQKKNVNFLEIELQAR